MIECGPDINIVKQVVDGFFNKPMYIERVHQGLSTFVYRIKTESATHYLRILPEDASFAVEVRLHELLIQKGILVLKVIHFEDRNNLLGLSLMIITEIPGDSIQNNYPPSGLEKILFQAGKQIALINQIPVDGFGWIDRKTCDVFKGEKETFHDYYFEYLYDDISVLIQYPFRDSEIVQIQSLLEKAYTLLVTETAYLVHGDFDVSHIFHNEGTFSGLIDFGEIRGNSFLYDLAVFRLNDATPDYIGYRYVLNGYKEVQELSAYALHKIDLLALFIGIRLLGKKVGNQWFHEHFFKRVKEQFEMILSSY